MNDNLLFTNVIGISSTRVNKLLQSFNEVDLFKNCKWIVSGESAAVEHLQNVLCRDQLAVSSCATTSYHTLCNTAGQTRGDH